MTTAKRVKDLEIVVNDRMSDSTSSTRSYSACKSGINVDSDIEIVSQAIVTLVVVVVFEVVGRVRLLDSRTTWQLEKAGHWRSRL